MTTDPQTEPDLTETQKAYNVASSNMFQLAAYGHHRYHPLVEALTDEGKRQQRDYNDRLGAAREELEAALLRLVAEHAETFPGARGPAWLRSLADDLATLSLLAVRPDERDFDTDPVSAVEQSAPADRAADVASCPGRELDPNPCRCPCYGCKHHCAAHNPDEVSDDESALDRAPVLLGAAESEEKLDLNVTRLSGSELDADEQVDPACKFDEGCHRVVACESGCAVTAAQMYAQLAAAPAETALRDRRAPCPAREPLLDVQCAKEAGHEVHADRPGRIWYPVTDDETPAEEAYRLALSTTLGLGTGANWEAIRDRAEDLTAEVEGLTEARRRVLDQQQATSATDRAAVLRETAGVSDLPAVVPAGTGETRDPRSDVGTEFVHQTDHPNEAGLATFEADLAAAPAVSSVGQAAHTTRSAVLERAVQRIGQMADAWEQQLPEVIRTPAVVSAIRAALEPVAGAQPAGVAKKPPMDPVHILGIEAPRCDVEFEGGGTCTKAAGHRTPQNQDPHTPPVVGAQQPKEG